jgi:hypothetical protein
MTEEMGYTSSPSSRKKNRYVPDGTSVAAIMSEEEIEAVMANFASEDTTYNKTWTRIVVENIFSKVSGYAGVCIYLQVILLLA